MHEPLFPDLYDWRGCSSVRFNPEKLGGRATVLDTRMDADGILINFEGGMTPEEISYSYGTDLDAIRVILKFAQEHDLQPRPQAITGHLKIEGHQFEVVISPWTAGHAVHISHRDGDVWSHTSEGIWETVAKAKEVAQEIVFGLVGSSHRVAWRDDAF
jgi:uncharacterized protein (DUF433 family)